MIPSNFHRSAAAQKRLEARKRADARLKRLGGGAVLLAVAALAWLVYTVGVGAVKAVYEYRVAVPEVIVAEEALAASQAARDQFALFQERGAPLPEPFFAAMEAAGLTLDDVVAQTREQWSTSFLPPDVSLSMILPSLTLNAQDQQATAEFFAQIVFAGNSVEQITAEARAQVNSAIMSDAPLILRDAMLTLYPALEDDPETLAQVMELVSNNAYGVVAAQIRAGEIVPGATLTGFQALMADEAQIYMKNAVGRATPRPSPAPITLTPTAEAGVYTLTADQPVFRSVLDGARATLRAQALRQQREADRLREAQDLMRAQRAAVDPADPEAVERADNRLAGVSRNLRTAAAAVAELLSRANAVAGTERLTDAMPSALVRVDAGWLKITEASDTQATAVMLLRLADSPVEAVEIAPSRWTLYGVAREASLLARVFGADRYDPAPEYERAAKGMSDLKVAAMETLIAHNAVNRDFAYSFFTNTDSRESEEAGVLGALVGAAWTMLVALIGAAVVGVASGVYLEEFAKKGWFSNMIETNINNLAAVPSIVFGLFGLMFLLTGFSVPLLVTIGGVEIGGFTVGGWFAEMRAFPIIGGAVLALMTLPTVVIATRAALRAVPEPFRDAALGLGASRTQTVFHHVLPLAAPGMLTGVIIGMAQALGETAPLMMIGMIGFVKDVPQSAYETATVMPGIILSWSDKPEQLFQYKTSLAIIVLLMFMLTMNALAILLRRRLERRW